MDQSASVPLASAVTRGLRGRCPRGGEGGLFAGFLKLRPDCGACGLDFAFADAGDGPAVFVIMIAGFIIAGAALVTEVAYEPPLWVHALLWGPLAVLICLGVLRLLKGLLVSLQHHFKASEGRLQRREEA